MRTTAKISGLLIIVLLFSCEELSITDCTECFSVKPERTNLQIKIGGASQGNNILLTIYEGNIEEDIVVFSEYVNNFTEFNFDIPLNKTFTAKATYNINNKVYNAVDSARPRLVLDEESCDQPCYIIRGNRVNVELRYY